MKLSLNWLKDFIDIKITPEQLAEKLTLSGTAVDSIERQADKYQNIIVGEILEIKPHPNADKLQVVKVLIVDKDKSKIKSQPCKLAGSKIQIKNQKFQVSSSKSRTPCSMFHVPCSMFIVCGATNIKIGNKVPVALPGVALPNGFKIEKLEIRGVKSEGMLCSQKELELGEDRSGILILDSKAKIGQPMAKILGLDDVILDLELTPNRGDCMSVIGMAREISALLNSKLKAQNLKPQLKTKNFNNFLQVKVLNRKLCPKYCAQVIKNVKVGESPEWLKQRLMSVGIRPINNIVDITNYVMMEMGQPLHAFDKLKVKSEKLKVAIGVRCSKRGERIVTLDGQKRELDESMLVITDGNKPIALAGVIGGIETEVSENTKDIILEAAIFDPISVRKTSRSLGLISEASLRFERQVDWRITEKALNRAAAIIAEIAGGQLQPAVIVKNQTPRVKKVKVSIEYLENLLGIKLGYRQIEKILNDLGFDIKLLNCQIAKLPARLTGGSNYSTARFLAITVPSWRPDIAIPSDIAEEIGRILDFNTFKPTNIFGAIKPPAKNNFFYWENKLKDLLAALGYSEVLNYSFIGETDDSLTRQLIGGLNCQSIEIIKPLSPEQKYLRQSLIPQLLKNASRNLRFFNQVKIFESSRVFLPQKNHPLPLEPRQIAGVLSIKNLTDYQLYKKLKGEIELLLNQLNVKLPLEYAKKDGQVFLKGKNNLNLGQIYLIDQEIKEKNKIRQNIIAFNLDLEILTNLASEQKKYTPIFLYPVIERDISFILPDKIYYQNIVNKLKFQDQLIDNIVLIDEYYPAPFQRSLTLRITYSSGEKTLTSKEIEKIEQKICSVLEKEFKAEIRR